MLIKCRRLARWLYLSQQARQSQRLSGDGNVAAAAAAAAAAEAPLSIRTASCVRPNAHNTLPTTYTRQTTVCDSGS